MNRLVALLFVVLSGLSYAGDTTIFALKVDKGELGYTFDDKPESLGNAFQSYLEIRISGVNVPAAQTENVLEFTEGGKLIRTYRFSKAFPGIIRSGETIEISLDNLQQFRQVQHPNPQVEFIYVVPSLGPTGDEMHQVVLERFDLRKALAAVDRHESTERSLSIKDEFVTSAIFPKLNVDFKGSIIIK
jgi:hypothetical protein